MANDSGADFEGRRAPYAPISALERFFERIRDRQAPERVDHRFLERLNVASNNEYALLSALKFLGVLDDRGRPTHSYRLLQTTDRFEDTLWHLVKTAYRPVFEAGAHEWPTEDLVNFFRVSSSASQAKNAARFFQAVCRLAGGNRSLDQGDMHVVDQLEESTAELESNEDREPHQARRQSASDDQILAAKARLLEKLPAAAPGWSAAEYRDICDRFLSMMRNLDGVD